VTAFRVGVVLSVRPGEVTLELGDGSTCLARRLPGREPPPLGRRALAWPTAARDAWVLGPSIAPPGAPHVAVGGARAELDADWRGITVRDASGDVLFRQRDDGEHRVGAAHGDLRLEAPRGAVRVTANDVRARGAAVAVDARGVEVRGGTARVALREALRLEVARLRASVSNGSLSVTRGRLVSERLRCAVERLRERATSLENDAKRLDVRGRERHAEVERVDGAVGRCETTVDEAMHARGASLEILSDGDVDVDGARVELG